MARSAAHASSKASRHTSSRSPSVSFLEVVGLSERAKVPFVAMDHQRRGMPRLRVTVLPCYF